jgi:hypothetical protein
MSGSINITKDVSADFGAYWTRGVFGLGFDASVRTSGDHKGAEASIRLGWLWLDANIYSIHHERKS